MRGEGERRKGIQRSGKKTQETVNMFIVLIVVMVLQTYTYVKTY